MKTILLKKTWFAICLISLRKICFRGKKFKDNKIRQRYQRSNPSINIKISVIMQIVIWPWKREKAGFPTMHSDTQGGSSIGMLRCIVVFRFLVSFFLSLPSILRPRVIKFARARHDASARARRRKLPGRATAHKSMTQVTGIGDLACRVDLPSFAGRRDARRDAPTVKRAHLSHEKSAPRELRFQFYAASFVRARSNGHA